MESCALRWVGRQLQPSHPWRRPERHIAHVTIVAEEVEKAEEVAEGDEATPEVISATDAEESTSGEPGSSDNSESDSE